MSGSGPVAGAAATAPIECELPTSEFRERRWFWGLIAADFVVIGVAIELALKAYYSTGLAVLFLRFWIRPLGHMWIRLAWERSEQSAIETRLRKLGFSPPSPTRDPNPTLLFFAGRDLDTDRSKRMAFMVMVGYFVILMAVIIAALASIMRPGQLGWTEAIHLISFFACFIVGCILIARSWLRIRRDDAALARWERERGAWIDGSAESPANDHRWPHILFDLSWDRRVDEVRDRWLGSGLASPEREPDFCAFEWTVAWLRKVERLPDVKPTERKVRREALRRVAWRYATALDPAITNY